MVLVEHHHADRAARGQAPAHDSHFIMRSWPFGVDSLLGLPILFVKTSRRGKLANRSSWQQFACQMELFKNIFVRQWLARKGRSRLRVICATPSGKGAERGGSERFL